jgi:CheY-like chemotaxis protein
MARILVADDDLQQVVLRQTLLEANGHEVLPAFSAVSTLIQIENDGLDLVIMDLRFPEPSDGLALIRRIRELGCHTPVVVLSGWPEDIYGQPEEAMVSSVMVKPVPLPVLLATIAQLVSANSGSALE